MDWMTPVLDEASLVPCPRLEPVERIRRLADTLRALDRVGASRILRSVRDAVDRDLGRGKGLRHWCFARGIHRDAGLLLAGRLGKAPFIDGPDGLFATAEGACAIHPTISGTSSFGGGYVALTDGVLALLPGSTWPPERPVTIDLWQVLDGGEKTERVVVDAVDSAADVGRLRDKIASKVDSTIGDGLDLHRRLNEVFPHLVLGERAMQQLDGMRGGEPSFRQVVRHFRALELAAQEWTKGSLLRPKGITLSVEAAATLAHGNYGPMRDFPTPTGFSSDRWSLHTKLTGANWRIYYKIQEERPTSKDGNEAGAVRIAIGYIGPHLPTVNYP